MNDLDRHARWLSARPDIDGFVVCGVTTNHCYDTTTRVGGNLGHNGQHTLTKQQSRA